MADLVNTQNLTPQQMSAYASSLALKSAGERKQAAIDSAVAARPSGTVFDPSTGTYKDPLSGTTYIGSQNNTTGQLKTSPLPGVGGQRFQDAKDMTSQPVVPQGYSDVAAGYKATQDAVGLTGNPFIDNRINGAGNSGSATGTLSSLPARNDSNAVSTDLKSTLTTGGAQFEALAKQSADAAAREKAKNDAELNALEAKQKEAKATASTLEFRQGQTGTDYATSEQAKLDAQHQAQIDSLHTQFSDYMAKADQALQNGQVTLAKELQAQAKSSADQAIALDKEKRDNMKAIDDMQKADVQEGGFLYSSAVSGVTPTDQQLAAHDQLKGYQPGTSKVLFGAAQLSAKKDWAGAADVMAGVLQKTDIGGTVSLGGVDYIVSGKANGVVNSVEVDSTTGENMAISYDPKTKTTTSTPMGTFSSKWEVREDKYGKLWRVNPETKQEQRFDGAVPLSPGPSQVTSNAALREGSVGPTLPGHEQNAGQCGAYVNWAYGKPIIGNTFAEKKNSLSAYPSVDPTEIRSGMTFLEDKYGDTGHIGLVGDPVYDPDTHQLTGFMANESNFVPPNGGKVSYSRFVSINDPHLSGFYDVPTPNLHSTGTDSVASNVANGTSSGFEGAISNSSDPSSKILSPSDLASYNKQYPEAGVLANDTLAEAQAKVAKAQQTPASEVDYSKPLNDVAMESTADRLASGEIDPDSYISELGRTGTTSKDKMAIETRASKINPDFSLSKWKHDFGQANDKTNNQAIQAINTVLPNIDGIISLSDAVQRGDWPQVNAGLRSLGYNTGDKGITKLNEMQNIITEEYGKAIAGNSVLSDAKLQQAIRGVDTAQSPENFASSMQVLKTALNNRKAAVYDSAGIYAGLLGANDDPNYKVTLKGPDGKFYPYDLSNPELRIEAKKALKAGYTRAE